MFKLCLSSVGVVLGFTSNDKISESIRKFGSVANAALEDGSNYLVTTAAVSNATYLHC